MNADGDVPAAAPSRRTRFEFDGIRGDLFGGLTAGVVALPTALAFGVQSGLGAAAGVYSAMALGFFAALLGGTRGLVSGPTGPMVVVSATVAANIAGAAGGMAQALGAVLLTFLLAGALQVGLGLVGVGRYMRYVPYSVLSGFMTGVGVIIVALQLYPLLGRPSPGSVVAALRGLVEPIQGVDGQALMLGVLTIALVYAVPRLTKSVPGSLVALVLVSGLSVLAGWDVPRLGGVPAGLPPLRLGEILRVDPALFAVILPGAITLAVLGAIDTLLTSLIADGMTRSRHDSRRELIGQGVGNMAAALIGGIPGSGATSQTVANIRSGGRGRLAGVTASLLVLAVLLGAGQLAASIPLAVLAGILITIGLGLIDVRGIKQLRHVPRADSAVLVLVLLFTVFFDLIQAVALGVALASILFMKRIGDEARRLSTVGLIEDAVGEPDHPDERLLLTGLQNKVLVKHVHGPLFFGSAAAFQDLVGSIPATPYLVFRMNETPHIDQSGLNAFRELITDLDSSGTTVFVVELQEQPATVLRDTGVAPGIVPPSRVLPRFGDVVPAIRAFELSRRQLPAA